MAKMKTRQKRHSFCLFGRHPITGADKDTLLVFDKTWTTGIDWENYSEVNYVKLAGILSVSSVRVCYFGYYLEMSHRIRQPDW